MKSILYILKVVCRYFLAQWFLNGGAGVLTYLSKCVFDSVFVLFSEYMKWQKTKVHINSEIFKI